MVCSARNEQGFVYYIHNSDWQPVDFDGIVLMCRPLPVSTLPKIEKTFATLPLQAPFPLPEQTSLSEITPTQNPPRPSESLSSTDPLKQPAESQSSMPCKTLRRRRAPPLPYTPWPEEDALPLNFVVMDTETTGLKPEHDRMIEASCIKIRCGKVTEEFQSLVQYDQPLSKTIRDMTGLNDKDLLRDGHPFTEVLQSLLGFIGDDWIVGHNVAFDIRFLIAECERAGIQPPAFRALDTMILSKSLLRDQVDSFRLEALAQHFGIAQHQFHRALPDAHITAQLYLKLNEIRNTAN